ncbi:MAG: PD-(D/E)XK nuclease family protein [Peptostreptococcaceae bacterium]
MNNMKLENKSTPEGRLKPQTKTFSFSKYKLLETCKYKYYLETFATNGWWLQDADEQVKETYMYKKLSNLSLQVGTSLHTQFKRMIESARADIGVELHKEDCINTVVNIIQQVIRESASNLKTGAYRAQPSKHKMLEEYFFGAKISKEEYEALVDKINTIFDNFLESQTYIEVTSDPEIKILEIDQDVFETDLEQDGRKLYFKTDLVYIKHGIYYVIDWKTGNATDEDKEQLLIYIHYVHIKYNVPLDKIKGKIEYLLTGSDYLVTATENEDKYITANINKGIAAMDALLVDVEANIPMPAEAFTRIDECGTCHACKYRILCGY